MKAANFRDWIVGSCLCCALALVPAAAALAQPQRPNPTREQRLEVDLRERLGTLAARVRTAEREIEYFEARAKHASGEAAGHLRLRALEWRLKRIAWESERNLLRAALRERRVLASEEVLRRGRAAAIRGRTVAQLKAVAALRDAELTKLQIRQRERLRARILREQQLLLQELER